MFVGMAGHYACWNFTVGHDTQTFLLNPFIRAMCIGTIDFYHFTPLAMTLTLAGGYKVSASQIYWLHFLLHFWSDQQQIWNDSEASQTEHPETL